MKIGSEIIKIVIVLLVIIVPSKVIATSGCCSHHGGVDCSTKQADGTVVCNDGWRGSSCSYDSMQKCRGTIIEDNTYNVKSDGDSIIIPVMGVGSVVAGGTYLYKKKSKNN